MKQRYEISISISSPASEETANKSPLTYMWHYDCKSVAEAQATAENLCTDLLQDHQGCDIVIDSVHLTCTVIDPTIQDPSQVTEPGQPTNVVPFIKERGRA